MKGLSLFVVLFVVLIASLFLAARCSEQVGCENLHSETGLPTKYVVTTCYVKVNGQWVPEKNWRPVSE